MRGRARAQFGKWPGGWGSRSFRVHATSPTDGCCVLARGPSARGLRLVRLRALHARATYRAQARTWPAVTHGPGPERGRGASNGGMCASSAESCPSMVHLLGGVAACSKRKFCGVQKFQRQLNTEGAAVLRIPIYIGGFSTPDPVSLTLRSTGGHWVRVVARAGSGGPRTGKPASLLGPHRTPRARCRARHLRMFISARSQHARDLNHGLSHAAYLACGWDAM